MSADLELADIEGIVKPSGLHHRDKLPGSRIAANTCSTVAGISRAVLNVVIGLYVWAVFK
jgi:hypothetical protein